MLEVNDAEHSVTGIQHDIKQFLQWLQQQSYVFHTVSPSSHAAYLSRSGQVHADNLRDIFGWSLPFEPSLLLSTIFKRLQTHQLIRPEEDSTLWRSQIRVATLNECLLIHSAYPTSQEDAVFFGPDTYRFVHALNQYLTAHQPSIDRALELCSGAAPAAITLARYAPHADVIAADINQQALQYSAFNAHSNQASNVRSVKSNLYQQITGTFDFITANPPYLVDAKQRLYRHGGDLMGAALSVSIVQASLDHLALNGTLLLYTGVVIVKGQDLFYQALQAHMASRQHLFSMHYHEIDSDIFADELDTGAYEGAERIAAVIVVIRRLG